MESRRNETRIANCNKTNYYFILSNKPTSVLGHVQSVHSESMLPEGIDRIKIYYCSVHCISFGTHRNMESTVMKAERSIEGALSAT